MLCNAHDKAYQRHEIDEILQWENYRVHVLHIDTKKEMAAWIKTNIEFARKLAKLFCGHAYPIRNTDDGAVLSVHEDSVLCSCKPEEFDGELVNVMIEVEDPGKPGIVSLDGTGVNLRMPNRN